MRLKLLRLSLIIVLFSLCFAAEILSIEKAERVLSLQDSIKLASENNHELLIVEKKRDIAKEKLKEVNAGYFPSIFMSGSYTDLNVNQPMTLPLVLGGTTLSTGISKYYATRFSLRQFLYTGGHLRGTTKQSKLDLNRVESEYNTIKKQIINTVTRAFYEVLYNSELVQIYKKAVDESEQLIGHINSQDSIVEYNLLRAEVQKNIFSASLTRIQDDYETSQRRFNRAVGIELNTEVRLVDELQTEYKEYDTNKSIARAVQYSPRLYQLRIQEDVYNVKVLLSKGERFPTVVFGADLEYGGNTFPPEGKSWTATVAFNFPLFNGWTSWARVRQARGELAKTRLQEVIITDEIKLQIQELYTRYQRAWESLDPMKRNKDLARKSFELVMIAYRNNEAMYIEVMNALMLLIQARVNYLETLFDYVISQKELDILINPGE